MELQNSVEDPTAKTLIDNQIKPKEEKLTSLLSTITIEPAWIGISSAVTIYIVMMRNYVMDKICVYDLHLPENICSSRNTSIEQDVQEIFEYYEIPTNFCFFVIIYILILFLGPWSDKSGRRKPLILLPILMTGASSLFFFISVYVPFFSTSFLIYTSKILLALGGAMGMYNLGVYTYLGDLCFKKKLSTTIVIGRNYALFHLSTILGATLAPVLYTYLNYSGLFLTCIILEMISFIICLVNVKDINVSTTKTNIFDIKSPIDGIQCLFTKRNGHRRRNIFLMLCVPIGNAMILTTDIFLNYVYLRNKFAWTEKEYGLYYSLTNIGQAFGIFGALKTLKMIFKMKDEHIGMLGAVSKILVVFIMMLGTKGWMIYASCLIGAFSGVQAAMTRPVLLKQILPNEQGRIDSISNIVEITTSLIVGPISNTVYYHTLKTFPSCFLFIPICACVIQFFCYAFVDKEIKKTVETDLM